MSICHSSVGSGKIMQSVRTHEELYEVYAEARHLLGPLIDALDEGEVVHSRDSGLVDYSQSGGD